jgi:transcriptional regulator with XRE-family HTH domain
MKPRLDTYLRTYRLRSALTQREIASLLGLKSGTHISRLEKGKRQPSHLAIVALTYFFDLPLEQLFPALSNDIQDDVVRHAYDLYIELQGKPSKTTKAKLDFLEAMLSRATKPANKTEV